MRKRRIDPVAGLDPADPGFGQQCRAVAEGVFTSSEGTTPFSASSKTFASIVHQIEAGLSWGADDAAGPGNSAAAGRRRKP